jgi:hypothetical protein
MARVRKPKPTLESLMFFTPEQKVLRFLLTEPTTSFTPRVISSKLKGVRGLGGSDGIQKILIQLEEAGLVDFLDNRKSVRLHDENSGIQILKIVSAICDLEGLKCLLLPLSEKGVIYGSRADGKAHSESEFDLYVVSAQVEDVKKVTSGYPLSKQINLTVRTPSEHERLEDREQSLYRLIDEGIRLWGSVW